jgi:hypothetical protein
MKRFPCCENAAVTWTWRCRDALGCTLPRSTLEALIHCNSCSPVAGTYRCLGLAQFSADALADPVVAPAGDRSLDEEAGDGIDDIDDAACATDSSKDEEAGSGSHSSDEK